MMMTRWWRGGGGWQNDVNIKWFDGDLRSKETCLCNHTPVREPVGVKVEGG